MNPAATVAIDQSCRNSELPHDDITLCADEDEETHVTVTAASEDGTETSSLEIIIDRAVCPVTESGAV